VAAHLAGGPTGPPGKCQATKWPSPPLTLSLWSRRQFNPIEPATQRVDGATLAQIYSQCL